MTNGDQDRGKQTLHRLQRIEDIPTLPAALLRIWDLTTNAESSADDLARALSADPGLTGSVLRLANSAYLGFPRKVSTVTQAVVVLGFETVRNLATGASVFRALRKKGDGADADGFFRHGLAAAVAARVIMERHAPQKAGTVFCAAILHDLGKLVMAEFLTDSWRELEERVASGEEYDEAEIAAAGMTHMEIGEWFAARWSFPEELTASVRWHHQPAETTLHSDCVAAVHLGDIVAHRCGAGGSGRPEAPVPSPEARTAMCLPGKDLEEVTAVVREMVADQGAAIFTLGA